MSEKRGARHRGVSRTGHVVSVIFRILNLSFPIVLLAGVAWALYRLLS